MLKEISKIPFKIFKFLSSSLDGCYPQFDFTVFRTEKCIFCMISKDQKS